MNMHTKAVLDILKAATLEIDLDDLNDALNELAGEGHTGFDETKIDQKVLRGYLVRYLVKQVEKTADQMIGMMQQIYSL